MTQHRAPDTDTALVDSVFKKRAAGLTANTLGHELGDWRRYGRGSWKASCSACGAEARVPASATMGFRRPEGPAVNLAHGVCRTTSRAGA